MGNVIITLVHEMTNNRWDLSLPDDIPLCYLLPKIKEHFGLIHLSDQNANWHLRNHETGDTISADSTLGDFNVSIGDVLVLKITGGTTPKFIKVPNEFYWVGLLNEYGEIFEICSKFTLIGKVSENSIPDVDIATYDSNNTCSRKHAQIIRIDDDFYIRDLDSKHGTYINEQLISRSERKALFNGDLVRFGKNGPIFKFIIKN